MAVLDWSERACYGGCDPLTGGRVGQQPADGLGSNGVGQEWPARERRQEVGVRVIIDGVTARDHRPHGMIDAEMAQDVLPAMHAALPVSETVACLREEDPKAHHQREEEGRETRPGQALHRPNITSCPGSGSAGQNDYAECSFQHPPEAFLLDVRACGVSQRYTARRCRKGRVRDAFRI